MININGKLFDEVTMEDIDWLLNNSDESFFFEFKDDDISPEKVVKEVCAFANTFGGYIIIGVNDKKEKIGITKWSEERVSNIMSFNISPTPVFSVRKIENEELALLIIMVCESLDAPYITNKGNIYERVSSSSERVKDSAKLQQLYYKNEKNIRNIDCKLKIEPISNINNLCAYIDFGFVLNSTDVNWFVERIQNYKFENVAKVLDSPCLISKTGQSYFVSFGISNSEKSLPSAAQNFIEIMPDGSVKCRFLVLDGKEKGTGNISSFFIGISMFQQLYASIFEKDMEKHFISAKWFEELTVVKQFVPIIEGSDPIENEAFKEMLIKHNEMYGPLRIITSNRIPKIGYYTIDRKEVERMLDEYNSENIISNLFYTTLIFMGYWNDNELKDCIDEIRKQKDKGNNIE